MSSNTFDRVLRVVESWHPKKDYKKEAGYRDDLMAFVRYELKELEKGSMWGFPQEHRIRSESGRHLADIGIDEKIGIELKRNFTSQGKYDTLVGQMKRFMRQYSDIIIVLCGEVKKELVDDLQVDYKKYSGGSILWQPEPAVEIVDKGKGK